MNILARKGFKVGKGQSAEEAIISIAKRKKQENLKIK